MVSPAEQEPPARALLPRPPHRRAKPRAARIVVVAQVSAARNPGRTMRKYTAVHARRCACTLLLCRPCAILAGLVIHSVAARPFGPLVQGRRRRFLIYHGRRSFLSPSLSLLPFSPNSRRPLSVSTSLSLSLSLVPRLPLVAVPGLRPCRRRGRPCPGRRAPAPRPPCRRAATGRG